MNDMNLVFVMLDVQFSYDICQIFIQCVGVCGVCYLMLLQIFLGVQNIVGMYNFDVYLFVDQKGMYMLCFVVLFEEECELLNLVQFQLLLEKMLEKFEVDVGCIEVYFLYFVSKIVLVLGVQLLMDYEVMMIGEVCDGYMKVCVKVLVLVMSLCFCLKKILQYGVYNQCLYIMIDVELVVDMLVELLICMVEEEVLCELWGLFKCLDEKFVIECVYENLKFVEDLVCDIVMCLNQDDCIVVYMLEVENFELIYNYSVYVLIECDKCIDK